MKRGAAVAVVLVLLGCAAPLPTASPTASPTVNATAPRAATGNPVAPPTTTPLPSDTPGLARYARGGLVFDYPAEWRVIIEGGFTGADIVNVAVGTGSWDDGCVTSGNAVHCSGSVLHANPGEVVVEVSQARGPAYSVYPVPDFDSAVSENGLAVDYNQSPNRTRTTIYVPGHRGLAVRAAWGTAPTDTQRSILETMIESISYGAGGPPATLQTWDGVAGPGPCSRETMQGQLARGDMSGLNLALSGGDPGFAFVSWPSGWTASIGEGRRLELLDESGAVVAREWDELSIGGRGDSNDFRACADSVSVIRRFPG